MALSRTDTPTKSPAPKAQANAKTRNFRTSVGMKPDVREKSVALLNQHLAACFDLYSQTKQAHWNVKGMDFIQLHELFDELAETVLPFVDLIAERVTTLGGYATGTTRMAAADSKLPEYPTNATQGKDHLEALVERYAAFGASTRAAIDTCGDWDDMDTADLFTEVSREIDKSLWFLEAHLQS
jgi:starvation-inducible DNA-binding protein